MKELAFVILAFAVVCQAVVCITTNISIIRLQKELRILQLRMQLLKQGIDYQYLKKG